MIRDHNKPVAQVEPAVERHGLVCRRALAGALVGLVHDANYATAFAQEPVEEGRNIQNKAVMEEGLDAAAGGRVVGLVMLLAAGGVCVFTMPRNTRICWDGLTLMIGLGLVWAVASCILVR